MTITELIKQLEEVKKKHGDIPVKISKLSHSDKSMQVNTFLGILGYKDAECVSFVPVISKSADKDNQYTDGVAFIE